MFYFFCFVIIVILHSHLRVTGQTCRCISSNSNCWPNNSAWQTFNASVNGRLISPQPSAAVCNSSSLNVTNACAMAYTQWTNASWRSYQAGAMQNPNWENSSCSVYVNNTSCNQGSVPILGVIAIWPEHVQTTVQFAAMNNLRLVIKTTGHDYLGRSTAASSLLLWLHYMKNMTIINQYSACDGENISNPVRISGGVQWGEVYAWLDQYNLTAIGGASGTVGSTGGYLQGGGHSPLSRWKGMAADNVLEFDVIMANGQRQTVNACQNTDLFWALRGGGGGTFAIVLSAVLRTFPSPPVLGAYYVIGTQNETRYAIFIRDFIRFIPILADEGWAGYFFISDTSIVMSFLAPNGNLTIGNATFSQFLNNNTDLQLASSAIGNLPSFYAYFAYVLASSNPTGSNVLLGSRLIPDTIVRNQSDQLANVFLQIRGQSQNQSVLIGHLVAGGQVSNMTSKYANNSVNPAWRTALLHMVYAQSWPDGTSMTDQQLIAGHITDYVQILQTVAGGNQSGCYMNEADPNDPSWQQTYFGTQKNYDRLKLIKQTVDPSGLFVCLHCVGSDDWSSDLNCPKISRAVKFTTQIFFVIMMAIFALVY